MVVKPYHHIPIQDCGEPLVPIPLEQFAVVTPHPYMVLGAPYGEHSPYYVRAGVLRALLQAQRHLQRQNPGWRIQIFDAYRPVAVQQFMVDHTYQQLLHTWASQQPAGSQETPPASLLDQVHQFWAVPSHDLTTPPPHSTGAAIDITLVNEHQQAVDMGSEIDEISERSYPNYFADRPGGKAFDQHRTRLASAMQAAGFHQHPQEWWHFSLGDQLWAWLAQDSEQDFQTARYGCAE
ncbi:MAG: M15 family metallopeptidase [Cyanobacteria bacterium P01_D01_bin.2]